MKKKKGVLTEVKEKDLKLLYKKPEKFWKHVTTIGHRAFSKLRGLENIHIPGTVKKIESNAFYGLENLEEVIIEDSVEEINPEAFIDNFNILKIKIPGDLKTVKKIANGSLNLEHIEIGEGVEKIASDAIYSPYFDMIILPKSLKNIDGKHTIGINHYYISKISENDLNYPGCTILSSEPLSEDFIVEKSFNTQEVLAFNGATKDMVIKTFINENKIGSGFEGELEQLNEYLLKNKMTLPYGFVQKLQEENMIGRFIGNTHFKNFKRLQSIIEKEDRYGDVYILAYNIGCFSKDPQLANAACTWLESIITPNPKTKQTKITIYELSKLSQMMPIMGENKEFSEFLFGKNPNTNISNFDEILENKNDRAFLSRIYREYQLSEDQVEEENKNRRIRDSNGKLKFKVMIDTVNEEGMHLRKQKELRPTVQLFKEYFKEVTYNHGGTEREKELVDELSKFGLSQEYFDDAMKIYKEFDEKNIPTNILGVYLKEIIDYRKNTEEVEKEIIKEAQEIINELSQEIEDEFTYEWLEKNDPKNFILGLYCNCCAHLSGAGHGIMKSNFVHPNIQNLVILNKKGKPVAKATAYINKKQGYMVFNNVEVANEVEEYGDQIYEKFMKGVKEFVEQYNLLNPSNPIKKVNVGMSNNDLEEQIKLGAKPSKILESLKFGLYGTEEYDYDGDWSRSQYTIHEPKKKK